MMGLYDDQYERFGSKKALKAHVGTRVNFEETSFFGAEFKGAGDYCVVLPTPQDRRTFATVTVTDERVLVKVK